MMTSDTTIAAIITGTGPGAVAGIRISGKEALKIADRIFSGPVLSYPSHTAHYGKIRDEQQEEIDQVLLLVMRAPKSYTGEDTVEIFCHGGAILPQKVLQTILQAGASIAKPGEFTLRAFLHGKMDLAQAEAVQLLIQAQNELAVKAAKEQLEGKLSQKVACYQKTLTRLTAILEAWVDFPEEDLAFMPFEAFQKELQEVIYSMEQLLATFSEGAKLQQGISLCLAGAPNVGKSSLMNLLLGKERAIVTPIAGTTRDILEEDVIWQGISFRLIDTAGLRPTECMIEAKGIEKSKEALQKTDLLLYLLDATQPEDLSLLPSFLDPKKTLLVWNKIDQKIPQQTLEDFSSVAISVKEETGIEELGKKVTSLVQAKSWGKEEIILSSLRHKNSLEEALTYCKNVAKMLPENLSAEFLVEDLKAALYALSHILGTEVTEDILDAIFSQFCLGK